MKYELIHKEQSLEVDIFNDFTKVSLYVLMDLIKLLV